MRGLVWGLLLVVSSAQDWSFIPPLEPQEYCPPNKQIHMYTSFDSDHFDSDPHLPRNAGFLLLCIDRKRSTPEDVIDRLEEMFQENIHLTCGAKPISPQLTHYTLADICGHAGMYYARGVSSLLLGGGIHADKVYKPSKYPFFGVLVGQFGEWSSGRFERLHAKVFTFCGSVLIAPQYLVSAAHCFLNDLGKEISLVDSLNSKLERIDVDKDDPICGSDDSDCDAYDLLNDHTWFRQKFVAEDESSRLHHKHYSVHVDFGRAVTDESDGVESVPIERVYIPRRYQSRDDTMRLVKMRNKKLVAHAGELEALHTSLRDQLIDVEERITVADDREKPDLEKERQRLIARSEEVYKETLRIEDTAHRNKARMLQELKDGSSFDIAVIKLARPVRDIEPIQIADSLPRDTQELHVVGFGVKQNKYSRGMFHSRGDPVVSGSHPLGPSHMGRSAKSLARVSILADRSCRIRGNPKIEDTLDLGEVFCTAPRTHNLSKMQSTCQGDSGGPVFSKRHGKMELYGIVSSGSQLEVEGVKSNLCDPSKGNIMKSVASSRDWIDRMINGVDNVIERDDT